VEALEFFGEVKFVVVAEQIGALADDFARGEEFDGFGQALGAHIGLKRHAELGRNVVRQKRGRFAGKFGELGQRHRLGQMLVKVAGDARRPRLTAVADEFVFADVFTQIF